MASLSAVDICNGALTKLGEATISALTDDNPRARACNVVFENTRDLVLQEHPWNFAIERQQIAADTNVPVYEFTSQYALPTTPYCLRVINIENADATHTWQVEGRLIVTDLTGPIKIKYIARRTNYQEWPPSCIEALEARIALEIAEKVTRSSTRVSEMAGLYQDKIRVARSADGQEGSPHVFIANSWTQVR